MYIVNTFCSNVVRYNHTGCSIFQERYNHPRYTGTPPPCIRKPNTCNIVHMSYYVVVNLQYVCYTHVPRESNYVYAQCTSYENIIYNVTRMSTPVCDVLYRCTTLVGCTFPESINSKLLSQNIHKIIVIQKSLCRIVGNTSPVKVCTYVTYIKKQLICPESVPFL